MVICNQQNGTHMKIPNYIILFSAILLFSCGPSAEQLAQQQKRHDDSVATATAQRLEQKNKLENQRKDFKTLLVKYTAELEAAKDKMNQIKEFHLLRTGDEREQQIEKQSIYISKLEENINTLTENIRIVDGQLANL
jgi:guanylate kinase